MQLVSERCAGLDVHKKTVVACLLIAEPNGPPRKERQTISRMTPDLLRLRDWLLAQGCTQVAMESTGVFWKPLFNVLEGHLEVLVVNAQHIKLVPGRKTDVKDAEWKALVAPARSAASQLYSPGLATRAAQPDPFACQSHS